MPDYCYLVYATTHRAQTLQVGVLAEDAISAIAAAGPLIEDSVYLSDIDRYQRGRAYRIFQVAQGPVLGVCEAEPSTDLPTEEPRPASEAAGARSRAGAGPRS